MSQEALRTLVILSTLNALLTLAFPAALVSPLYMAELSSALRLLAILSIMLAGVGCFTILGLRRYLVIECDFDGASGALAVHAGVTAASGIAILTGWGVLLWGSGESELSWLLGLTVLGFFLLVGIAIGVLELLVGSALGRTAAEGFGLLVPIRVTFLIVGVANLTSIVLGVTIIVGMVAYAVVSVLFVLLFYAAWRERAGHLPEDFHYGKGWIAVAVTAALFAVVVPGAATVYQLRNFGHDTEAEILKDESQARPEARAPVTGVD